MRIRVAPDLCCGAQRCSEVAPDVYKIVDGFNALVGAADDYTPPKDLENSARRGAKACPESAIKIIED